jgi:putative transposase
MSGRVTRRGLSRGSDTGGSARTIQRFFTTSVHGCQLHFILMRQPWLDADEVLWRSGEQVGVTTAGTATDGFERLFSSRYGT